LVAEYQVAHISVGDLLREEVASKSEDGQSIDALMKEGKIVPLEVVLKVLNKALEKHAAAKCILIDGFPREMQQAIEFEKTIGQVKAVFFFECSEELMEKRLLKRGETSGRSDDNAETIKKRFKTFQEQSLPVTEYFEKQGRLVRISSEPPVDEVYAKVKENFIRVTGTTTQ
jgi:adenylate kinase